jgi:hypothetical protein
MRKKMCTVTQVNQAGKPLMCALKGHFTSADRGHAADGGHIAFVEVAEGGARLAGEVGGDHFRDVVAHLHGGLGDAGNLMAILLEVGEIAEDKDLGQRRAG